MAYKSLKGKWEVGGDKPVITLLPNGLICFNKVCYERYIKVDNYGYVKLYYEPEMKKIAFQPLHKEIGERVFPISLIKPGLLAVIRAKTFLTSFGIKYEGQVRSYPVHETYIIEPGSGYKRTWSEAKIKVIEIRLDEYLPAV